MIVEISWNHDLVLKLECPLSHYWTSPLNCQLKNLQYGHFPMDQEAYIKTFINMVWMTLTLIFFNDSMAKLFWGLWHSLIFCEFLEKIENFFHFTKIGAFWKDELMYSSVAYQVPNRKSLQNNELQVIIFIDFESSVIYVKMYLVYSLVFELICRFVDLWVNCKEYKSDMHWTIQSHSERRPQNIYSQEEINLYCIGNRNVFIFITNQWDMVFCVDKMWTFGNPFQSKKLPICT